MTEAQMNSNDDTLDSLDDTLDDLADLPSTKPFVPGAYLVSMTVKRQPKKPSSFIAEFVHKETVELTNPNTPEEELSKEGDKTTIFITTKKTDGTPNEFGQGQIKQLLAPLGELYNTRSISEILEANKGGADVHVVFGIQKSKDEKYPDDKQTVKAIQLA